MKHIFNILYKHRVLHANTNIYKVPAAHPTRCLGEHDLIYITEGEWTIGQEKEIFNVKKDNVLILGGNLTHYGVLPCAEGTKTLFIHTDVLNGDGFTTANDSAHSDNDILLNSLIDASKNKRIKMCFLNIIEAKAQKNEQKASVYFDLLLCELAFSSTDNQQTNTLAEKIKRLIDLSGNNIIKNTEIADKLNISVKTAENSFKKYYKTTIHQYILNKRVEEAKFYLKNFPDMKLCEIALNLGFYDEFHFSRHFKNTVGESPTVFRKRILNSEEICCP